MVKTKEKRTNSEIYLLLGANNIDSDISVSPYTSYEEAFHGMMEQFTMVRKANPDKCSEAEVSGSAASIYTTDNDLFYWNIKKLEREETDNE